MSFVAGAAAGGKVVGLGLLALGLFRFVQWFCEFCARRYDAMTSRMTEKERIADASIATRLRHLEQQQQHDARKIAGLEQAVQKLVTRVRIFDPADPVLVEIAEILAATFGDFDKPLEVDDLMEKLNKVPSMRRPRPPAVDP